MGQALSNSVLRRNDDSSPQSQPQKDETPIWCRYLANAVGTIGGLNAMILGVIVLISIHAYCLIAGILSILNGCILILMEAPCCCGFLDFVEQIANFSRSRSHWQKAAVYGLMSTPPLVFCFGISTVASQIGTLLTAMLYAMLSLGKKGDLRPSTTQQPDEYHLVEQQAPANF